VTQDRAASQGSARRTWDEVLAILQGDIDTERFDRFVRPLRLVALDAETARVEAPDRLSLLRVTEELLDPIRDALAALVGPREIVLDLRGTTQGELFPVGPRRRVRAYQSELQPRYTFDTFIVGGSNQFARAVCQAVARQPGEHYNPLFIYGGVGLGKTHLVTAIANAIIAANPAARVAYLSSERFTTELIAALRSDRVAGFKRRYRSLDVLILDDVQVLAGRDRTQEELFHTFNALHDLGRQIVLTADRVPEDIPGLEERLRNRFQWGLVADIQPPDLETRVAILERRAEADGVHLPEDAALALAEHIATNVRSLEGALTRVAAQASLSRLVISGSFVRHLIAQGQLGRHGPITFDEIAHAVCDRYGVSVQQLLSRRRTKQVAIPRQVAMYLCRHLLEASYPRIGSLFGRDHTTAIHGVRVISSRIRQDPALQAEVSTIEHRLEHS